MTAEGRDALLDRIRLYVRERGIAGLSIEKIAPALGLTVDDVHQYFVNDIDVITALVAQNRVRLREGFARLDEATPDSGREFRRAMWEVYLNAADDSALFFEAYGLAMHDQQYGAFLHGVNDWIELMTESGVRRGETPAHATAMATLTLAAYRGAMLDYCVTRDRARVNAAMEVWLDLADRIEQRRTSA